MTVKELIAELQLVEQDLEVLTEGCDCVGGATGVKVHVAPNDDNEDQTYLVIIRDGLSLD